MRKESPIVSAYRSQTCATHCSVTPAAIESPAGTTRNAATIRVKTSWPVKIRRSRMVSSSSSNRAAGERAGQRKDEPGDEAEPDRKRGRCGKIRCQGEFGIDQHWQHIDIGRERECGAERAH